MITPNFKKKPFNTGNWYNQNINGLPDMIPQFAPVQNINTPAMDVRKNTPMLPTMANASALPPITTQQPITPPEIPIPQPAPAVVQQPDVRGMSNYDLTQNASRDAKVAGASKMMPEQRFNWANENIYAAEKLRRQDEEKQNKKQISLTHDIGMMVRDGRFDPKTAAQFAQGMGIEVPEDYYATYLPQMRTSGMMAKMTLPEWQAKKMQDAQIEQVGTLPPISPIDQSVIQKNEAQANLYGAQAGGIGLPPPTKTRDITVIGQDGKPVIRTIDESTGNVIAEQGQAVQNQTVDNRQNEIARIQAIPTEARTPLEQATLQKLLTGTALNPEYSTGTIPKPVVPSSTERTKLAEADQSRRMIENLNSLYKDNYVGLAQEKLTKAGGYLGLTTKEQENFAAATSALKNSVIKQITGAQMSEQEADRILQQVPTLNDPPIRWKAKRDQTLKNIEMLEQAQINTMNKGGVYTGGYGQQPQTQYKVGDIVQRGGKNYKVQGFYPDGDPDVVEVK